MELTTGYCIYGTMVYMELTAGYCIYGTMVCMELTTGYCIYGTMVCMQHCSTPLYTFLKFGQSTSVLPSRTN
jgi:hypothetical protein